MLPDALIPDGWKTSVEDAGKEVDKLSTKLNKVKDKNAKLGITTTESQTQTIATSYHNQSKQGLSNNIIPMSKATPLTNQTVKSQAEVALTIKSDKPVTIDKAKSEKGTDLSLNVGNMSMSY
ncbi:conserved hypothetical protein [Aliivibrio fischeri MJ11]|uniref:Uncharacterized protein n=1 Tax=Aliivibrio fischeri (strain MJ11) TaxID=388396 RepID=B5FF46_ALIFM|nr:hypothetical protein [Aliivibrio fischeri]ACH66750.1 conserved hypothetical protein [Aliivibrio fischeri MJ11]